MTHTTFFKLIAVPSPLSLSDRAHFLLEQTQDYLAIRSSWTYWGVLQGLRGYELSQKFNLTTIGLKLISDEIERALLGLTNTYVGFALMALDLFKNPSQTVLKLAAGTLTLNRLEFIFNQLPLINSLSKNQVFYLKAGLLAGFDYCVDTATVSSHSFSNDFCKEIGDYYGIHYEKDLCSSHKWEARVPFLFGLTSHSVTQSSFLSTQIDIQKSIIDHHKARFSSYIHQVSETCGVDIKSMPFAIYAVGSIGRGSAAKNSDLEFMVVLGKDMQSEEIIRLFSVLDSLEKIVPPGYFDHTVSPFNMNVIQHNLEMTKHLPPDSQKLQQILSMPMVLKEGQNKVIPLFQFRRPFFIPDNPKAHQLSDWVDSFSANPNDYKIICNDNPFDPHAHQYTYVNLKRFVLDHIESQLNVMFYSTSHSQTISYLTPLGKLNFLFEKGLISKQDAQDVARVLNAIANIKISTGSGSTYSNPPYFNNILHRELNKLGLTLHDILSIRSRFAPKNSICAISGLTSR